jgi:hypothetical protein
MAGPTHHVAGIGERTMSYLPYHKIDEIRDALQGVDLENLVAVFSQATGSERLLVYVDPPFLEAPETGRIVSISDFCDLPDQDLFEFDGPTVGFSAIDVVRPNVPTKGPGFYAIERLFRGRGLYQSLDQTRRNLAHFLVDYLAALPPEHERVLRRRGVTKVLQLSLPVFLASQPVENLVAALPAHDLHRVAEGEGWRLIYNDLSHPDDLGGLDVSTEDWIVALEEVGLFQPALNPQADQFLELRNVLCDSGQETALRQTCRNLALRCYAHSEDEPRFLDAAVSLMAEVWLSTEDTEDMVAFFPYRDFPRFVETGDGLRVYRQLAERDAMGLAGSGPRCSLSDLVGAGLPQDYGGFALSLISLPDPVWPSGVHRLDLGPILWKAGQRRSLARTLWLVVSDGLRMSAVERSKLGLAPEALTDLATRAIILCGLDNPWQWRQGRYALFLDGCYHSLQDVLRLNAGSASEHLASYYHALIRWYGCHDGDAEGIHNNLEEMSHLFKDFLWKTRDDSPTAFLEVCRANATRLEEIVEAALHSLVGLRPPCTLDSSPEIEITLPPAGVPDVLRAASARPKKPADVLSPFFEYAWQVFGALCSERRQLQSRQQDMDTLLGQLKKLLVDFERHKSQIFALPHETAVLYFAYDQQIKHLKELIGGLESSAILEIELKNLWLDLQAEPDLHFEVTNIGRVAASDIEIVLVQDSGFELLEGTPVHAIVSLPPGASETVTYPVRPLQPEAIATLSYTYWGQHGQKQEGTRQFRPEVRNLELLPFKQKVNRYEFGRPIQEPGDFFGRRQELFNILSLLRAGGRQNVLLRGPRRMGKTSLLYMIKHTLEEPKTRRLFDVPREWDANLNRTCPVFITLQSVDLQSSVSVNQFFQTLLEQICRALVIGQTAIRTIIGDYATRSQEIGAANAVLEQLDAILGQRPGHRVVVLLDEYDEVYRPAAGDLDTALRTVVSAEQRMTWIIASTLGLYKESKSVGSPWFNVFLIVELGRMSQSAAQDLVQVPSRGERVYWRSDAVLSLLEETGMHPAFIQLFCSKLIAHLNQERTNYVLNNTITTIASQVVEEQETAHSHFEFYWSDASGVSKLILLIVDDSPAPLKRAEIRRQVQRRLEANFGDRPSQRVLDPAGNLVEWRELQFKDGMDWVNKVSNAISRDKQGRFHFTVPLFHRWLIRRRKHEDLSQEALESIAADMERDNLV